jgi:tetratricopeptide (TPR) repeat protein
VIAILIALAIAQGLPAGDVARFQSCTALVKSQPENGVASANDWLAKGGGILARQCLGLGYSALERWAPAATAFEQAASEAETKQDPRRADFWIQAGNAWLAAGDGAKARTAFDAALATSLLAGALRGEVHLDRARAGVQLGDIGGARKDLEQGLQLVPADPSAWYLSSGLAMREGDLVRAQKDAGMALSLAPDDPDILLHAGNVAAATGDEKTAREFYSKVATAAPGSPAGKAAQAALAGNPAAVTSEAPK